MSGKEKRMSKQKLQKQSRIEIKLKRKENCCA
jgi:hypothetical protein